MPACDGEKRLLGPEVLTGVNTCGAGSGGGVAQWRRLASLWRASAVSCKPGKIKNTLRCCPQEWLNSIYRWLRCVHKALCAWQGNPGSQGQGHHKVDNESVCLKEGIYINAHNFKHCILYTAKVTGKVKIGRVTQTKRPKTINPWSLNPRALKQFALKDTIYC